MTFNTPSVEGLAREFAAAVVPLSAALQGPNEIQSFVEQLGWQLPDSAASIGIDRSRVDAVITALETVRALDDTATSDDIARDYAVLVGAVGACAKDIVGARGRLAVGLDAGFLAATDIATALPRRLLDFLIAEYLSDEHPAIYQALRVLGILELTDVPRNDATFTSGHVRRTIRYERLTQPFLDPNRLFRDVYGWGTPGADLDSMLERLYDFALVVGLPAGLDYPPLEKEIALSAPVLPTTAGEAQRIELRVPVLGGEDPDSAIDLGVTLMPLPTTAAGGAPGLALAPYTTGLLEATFPLDQGARWTLSLSGDFDLVAGVGLVFRPGQHLSIRSDIFGTSNAAAGSQRIDLNRFAEPDERLTLLTASDGMEISAETVVGTVAATASTSHAEVMTELTARDGRLRLSFGSPDSFLAAVLPSQPFDLNFEFGLGWSSERGLYLTGGAGLEYAVPLHQRIGPLQLSTLHLSLGLRDSVAHFVAAVSGSGRFGPITVSVESVGTELVMSFPDEGGNLGSADIEVRFKPPDGVGLVVDAGVVSGGGYLFFNEADGQYAGVLELSAGFLSLNAIGLITTRLPGGQAGFSLLVIITAEFDPGFQLGFGFTLLGVGGLLGLNRRVLLGPLAEGVRTGAVNRILFPRDVVANAPRILSDIRAIFPPHEGTFLIGPMAKIGWGTPTLISISLGIVIEIPGNVVILGRVVVALPTEDAPVILLQVAFIGALEFDKKRVWFFAALYDSRLLTFPLEGEMGLLMAYGDNPNFVLPVGGFHPRFSPPPLPFPTPRRLAIPLVNEESARVRAEAYFAVTSNTVQLGCRAEAFFGFDAFSVEGYLTFNALLRFSPLYLIVEISAGFSVKVFGVGVWGVHLRGSLEGPTPWHVNGSAEIELLFWSFDVDVEVTFGERRQETLPPIAVMPRVLAEFEKLESWQATPPPSGRLFVSLRNLRSADVLVLHPVGTLRISQRFVPLGLPLDRVGAQRPSDVNRVTVSVASDALERKGPTREMFAAAQFRDMDDAAKLSAPSFEPLDSGVELGARGSPWLSGPSAERTVRYETIILDTALEPVRIHFFEFWAGLFEHFRHGASVSKSPVSLASERKLQPFAERVAVAEPAFTVAFQENNRPIATTATFDSFAEAQAHVADAIRTDPNLIERIHVIPASEVKRAA